MIAWLTGKLVAVLMFVLLMITLPTSIYFGARYEGIYFLGWTLVDGAKNYKPQLTLAVHNLKLCQKNEDTLNGKIDEQNAKIAALARDSLAKGEAADAALAKLKDDYAALQQRFKGMNKPLDISTPVAAVRQIQSFALGGLQ